MSTKELIRCLSKHIYHYLTHVFSFKLGMDERGINDHLVFTIAEYCHMQKFVDVLIYKSRAPKTESKYGHDFDLYVECCPGLFMYFALQAKVMNFNGKYAGFDISKKQWEKMKKHEKDFRSKAFYMFYNGKYLKSSAPFPARTDCLGIPIMEEYGIGIVENCEVEKVATTSGKTSLSFADFFPDQMDAFRKLFYCPCGNLGITHLHSINEIDTKPPYFQITSNSDDFEDEEYKDFNPDEVRGNAPIRIIVKKFS